MKNHVFEQSSLKRFPEAAKVNIEKMLNKNCILMKVDRLNGGFYLASLNFFSGEFILVNETGLEVQQFMISREEFFKLLVSQSKDLAFMLYKVMNEMEIGKKMQFNSVILKNLSDQLFFDEKK